jgi:hypothetical protein
MLSFKLTPGATPTAVTCLDRVRFSVTWPDAAPADAVGLAFHQPASFVARELETT